MPIERWIAVIGAALLALSMLSDALLGDGGARRFDPAYYASATYAPRGGAEAIGQDRQLQDRYFNDDVTPAERVKDVFAQISVGDSKRLKRYSALTTSDRGS